MRLNMGTTRKETEKTLCVYRYTDIEDEQIKYVGIVRKGKLSNRLQSHETDDEWCKNRGWFIEYFDCDTQSEAEAFEAHLIALYGTDKYYNVKKAGWGINKYLLRLAEKQIKLAFERSQAEVDYLRQRTVEGMETARLNGKQIGGVPGKKLHVKKAEEAKELIKQLSKDFDGTLTDAVMIEKKLAGVSRNSFYKYKRELKDEMNAKII